MKAIIRLPCLPLNRSTSLHIPPSFQDVRAVPTTVSSPSTVFLTTVSTLPEIVVNVDLEKRKTKKIFQTCLNIKTSVFLIIRHLPKKKQSEELLVSHVFLTCMRTIHSGQYFSRNLDFLWFFLHSQPVRFMSLESTLSLVSLNVIQPSLPMDILHGSSVRM